MTLGFAALLTCDCLLAERVTRKVQETVGYKAKEGEEKVKKLTEEAKDRVGQGP